jgi:hypothetical protein
MNPNEVLSLPMAPAPALNMAAAADSMFNAAGTDMVILESSNSGMLKRNRLLARRDPIRCKPQKVLSQDMSLNVLHARRAKAANRRCIINERSCRACAKKGQAQR